MTEAAVNGLATSPALGKALGVSFQSILDEGGRRQIVFQTHVDQDTPLSAINALLDLMRTAVERQQAISERIDLAGKVDRETRNLAMFLEAAETIEHRQRLQWDEVGRKGPYDPDKLPARLRAERQQAKDSLERTKNAIKLYRKRLEELDRIIHHAPASPADSQLGVLHSEDAGNGGAGRAEA